ncbi:hypothetical protein KQH40_01375 [bacterium]|nr:hypothetical protein [bacterium]
MTRYVLAAEADKIQDLIFRSSKLREVVGGSQLLTKFCQEAAEGQDVITNDGGSFRLVFSSQEDARQFGVDLANRYRQKVGGTISVGVPTRFDDVDASAFQASMDAAQASLRLAKRHQTARQAIAHLPYQAICSSCGRELAQGRLEGQQYICPTCKEKEENRSLDFLQPFIDLFPERNQTWKKVPTAEDMGVYDRRGYVAYLVADGNDMGKLFGSCEDRKSMTQLSERLPEEMRASLAEPAKLLIDRLEEQRGKALEHMPVLPLILGGDDLFALMPASWGLDFTLRFVEAFNRRLQGVVENHSPIMCAAVVICKASYPYYLAHQLGEHLLGAAKRMSKQQAVASGASPQSVINFEVLLGSSLKTLTSESNSYWATLKPYWAFENVEGWGISLQKLLEARFVLHNLPKKRLAELRSLFANLPDSDDEKLLWQKQLDTLVERTGFIPEQGKPLIDVLEILGTKNFTVINRLNKSVSGHGLPDLIEAWDYFFKLDKDKEEYQEQSNDR